MFTQVQQRRDVQQSGSVRVSAGVEGRLVPKRSVPSYATQIYDWKCHLYSRLCWPIWFWTHVRNCAVVLQLCALEAASPTQLVSSQACAGAIQDTQVGGVAFVRCRECLDVESNEQILPIFLCTRSQTLIRLEN